MNPTFVTPDALAENAAGIADGFVTSVAGSAGQLCTKPGFLFVPEQHPLAERVAQLVSVVEEHRLLNPGIAAGYRARRDAILGTPGVTVIAEGSLRIDEDGQGWATPTIVSVPVATLQEHRTRCSTRRSVRCRSSWSTRLDADLAAVADELFQGNLTGTVHAASGERRRGVRSLVPWIAQHAGRVLFGGWPTGVAVTPAMQHGGPWPATTNDSAPPSGRRRSAASCGRRLPGRPAGAPARAAARRQPVERAATPHPPASRKTGAPRPARGSTPGLGLFPAPGRTINLRYGQTDPIHVRRRRGNVPRNGDSRISGHGVHPGHLLPVRPGSPAALALQTHRDDGQRLVFTGSAVGLFGHCVIVWFLLSVVPNLRHLPVLGAGRGFRSGSPRTPTSAQPHPAAEHVHARGRVAAAARNRGHPAARRRVAARKTACRPNHLDWVTGDSDTTETCQSPVARYCTFFAIDTAWSANRS